MRQLTDSTGAVTFARTYDPYGVVTTSTGASSSGYGFTNEYQSQGLIYLRSRHYAPGMGRFLTRDTWPGEVNRPLSLNRWGYVEGNPVNFVDPSGLFSSFYADFVSDSPTGFHEVDKHLVDISLDYIADAYLRGYRQYVDRLMLSRCSNDEFILAITSPSPGKLGLFLGIHKGTIKFTKINSDPGYWAYVRARNDIYIYLGGVLSNWNTYKGMGGTIGQGAVSPADIYLDFLKNYGNSYSDEYFDKNNWIEVQEKYKRFITHEVGHAFDSASGQVPRQSVKKVQDNGYLPNPVSPYEGGGFYGTKSDGWQWRLASQHNFEGEIFADMFVGWVNSRFSASTQGAQRSDFMSELMPGWIFRAYHQLPSVVLP